MKEDKHKGKRLHLGEDYIVIVRDGYLEIYDTTKGPIEDRETPDVLLLPEEVETLIQFIHNTK